MPRGTKRIHLDQKSVLIGRFDEVFGTFYFINYTDLIPLVKDDTALAFRYLYLCTFADKNGRLLYDEKMVRHKDFKNIFGLNKNATSETIAKMENLDLIYKDKSYYYINSKYYVRNNILPNKFKGKSARIIDLGVQELYGQAQPRKHAMLGKILILMEYLNKYNNIICTKDTVKELQYNDIKPLTGIEICKICGRSIDNSHTFIKELNSFTIERLPFVRRIVDNSEEYRIECYIVNPYFVYMGSRNDHLEWTFKILNKQED